MKAKETLKRSKRTERRKYAANAPMMVSESKRNLHTRTHMKSSLIWRVYEPFSLLYSDKSKNTSNLGALRVLQQNPLPLRGCGNRSPSSFCVDGWIRFSSSSLFCHSSAAATITQLLGCSAVLPNADVYFRLFKDICVTLHTFRRTVFLFLLQWIPCLFVCFFFIYFRTFYQPFVLSSLYIHL